MDVMDRVHSTCVGIMCQSLGNGQLSFRVHSVHSFTQESPIRITLANLYTQIDEYVQEIQYWGVHIYQFYKHSDTNLRFCLNLLQFKLQTSGNSAHMFTVVQVFALENFQYNC